MNEPTYWPSSMTWHLILVPCHCYSLILNGAEYQWLSSILLPSSLSASWKGSYKIKLAERERWILVIAFKVEYFIRFGGHCTTTLSYRLRDWSVNPDSFLHLLKINLGVDTARDEHPLSYRVSQKRIRLWEQQTEQFFLDTWLDGTFKK